MRLNHGHWAESNHFVEEWLVHGRRVCMRKPGSWFETELEQRGVSRREFVEFCGVMATALALPKVFGARIAEAVLKAEKPVIVWLEFQDCAGNTESFLRATKPTVADIVLDVLSVDYHETVSYTHLRAHETVLDLVCRL